MSSRHKTKMKAVESCVLVIPEVKDQRGKSYDVGAVEGFFQSFNSYSEYIIELSRNHRTD